MAPLVFSAAQYVNRYLVSLFENATTLAEHLTDDKILIAHYERLAAVWVGWASCVLRVSPRVSPIAPN